MTPETIWRYAPRDILANYGNYLTQYSGTPSRTFAAFAANMLGWHPDVQRALCEHGSTHTLMAMMYAIDNTMEHKIQDQRWGMLVNIESPRAAGFDITDCLCYAYMGMFRDGVSNVVELIWTKFGEQINIEKLAGFFSWGAEQRCLDFEVTINMFAHAKSKATAQGLVAMMNQAKMNPHFQTMLVGMREYRTFAPAVENMARLITQAA